MGRNSRTQVRRAAADAKGVEQPRSSLYRLAPVALTALGIFGAVLMIFAGLLALNHTVLPFDGWPLNNGRLGTERQGLPRAPAETGRLRTAPGGTLAEINAGRVVISARPAPAVSPAPLAGLGVLPQRATSQSSVPIAPVLSRPGVDSDHDGLDNRTERQIGSNPLVADSDGDGIPDGWEVANGLNPTAAADATTDTDGDGLTNQTEFKLKDNPQKTDSNGDGT